MDREHDPSRALRREAGFALSELMVVVLIVAILIGIAVPLLSSARERAQDRAAESSLRTAEMTALVVSDQGARLDRADATALAVAEPGVEFVDAATASTGPSVVSVAAATDGWTATVLSDSGTCFFVVLDAAGSDRGEASGCAAGGYTPVTSTRPIVVNLALTSVPTQSGQHYPTSGPEKAIDGNTNGDLFTNRSVSHTQFMWRPWMNFELAAPSYIESIALWNRTDCCSTRASNVVVLVDDAPMSDDLATARTQAALQFTVAQVGTPSTVAVGAEGRYVKVFIDNQAWLHLAEVEIFGYVE